MIYKTAEYYDDIYAAAEKDYRRETRLLHRLIRKFKISKGKSLLDAACGTGIHADLLSRYYAVEGVDIDTGMLAVARRKFPGLAFYEGDIVDLRLPREYDVITCLFSAIGHVRTKTRLRKAIRSMAAHLVPGGLLVVEPWFAPAQWHVGYFGMIEVQKPDYWLVRMSYSGRRRKVSLLEFEYLIGTSKGIQHIAETLELGLFEQAEYLEAFERAGLQVTHDPEGLSGRGLYLGLKP